ncbi:hypothetical protein G3480_14680 [Thiorhodococcus mannitoliphagus]|uniref:Prepilin-type N-terminal cleavage/methylation domain-containing protein n=1 Tax=Thiorhodococcus mannitoliphagus TaxID=329406 RepID=A0A6P1DUW4_9GAMM|nr:prepilin-type N-terminal cleavage/methylation domain-containing protein [Thiorhodococcus mannitoliphagus]NEX21539.1 hypothetical protein [Thiorhodococcus mannitoliphagus]
MQRSIGIHKERGFTLSEAMISLTLLTSGLLALAQFQGEVHESSRSAKARTYAISLAQQKLEALRHQAVLDYATIESGGDRPPIEPGSSTEFHRHWTVAAHANPDFKDVKVYTEWQSTKGEPQSVGVSSILTPSRPYPAGNSSAPPFAVEETTPQIVSESTPATLNPMQTSPSATCICALSPINGSADLDPRSSDESCSPSCCESHKPKDDALCSRDTCTFIARCEPL